MKSPRAWSLALVVLALMAGCGKRLDKAPVCKGTYEPVNTAEHYRHGENR